MRRMMRVLGGGLGIALCLSALSSCGGGGGSKLSPPAPPPPTGNNVVSVIVDEGPLSTSNPTVNTLYTTITVCFPGSAVNCQTIDHIEVDTGSYGLRILAPVMNATLNLPVQMASNGDSLVQCTQFVDGYSWGPVVLADIQIGGESAASLPIQSIGDPRFTTVPADCSSTGTAEDTVATFGANGILGIGPFELDCPACETTVIPGTYYACTSTTCTGTTVAAGSQVPNPVTKFAADNNGTIIQLPSVANAGAATLTGTLTFGIDTQTNNASGTETVLTVNDLAELTMVFNGTNWTQSFIDSGSNGIYFTDASITACTTMNLTDFYCPGTNLTLPLTIQGANGVMTNNLTFLVGNAQTMLSNPAAANYGVFPLLAGTNPNQQSFDYGLAFFYSRRVATAIEGATTTAGTGPYVAF
ncbi:MAG: DUF3443 family protein [Steroidobacteraceae bacterium]